MDKKDYEKLWNNSFYPWIENYLKKYKNLYFDKNKKYEIYYEYEIIRIKTKAEMLDEDELVDRHKIASMLVLAIIKVNPLSFVFTGDINQLVKPAEYLANEFFAISCASSIIRSFVVEKKIYGLKITNELGKGMSYPLCDDNSSYIYSLAKLLKNEYVNKKEEFNIFTFSSLLFLLEKFTVEYYK